MSNLFDRLGQSSSSNVDDDYKGGGGDPHGSVPFNETDIDAQDRCSEHSPSPSLMESLIHISPSKHDRILEVDSLSSFTIPKARKQKRKATCCHLTFFSLSFLSRSHC